MLGQRLRRWPNIAPAFGDCLSLCHVSHMMGEGQITHAARITPCDHADPMPDQFWLNAGPPSHTTAQRSASIGSVVSIVLGETEISQVLLFTSMGYVYIPEHRVYLLKLNQAEIIKKIGAFILAS